MTYTLFEYAKENADDLMADQTEEMISQVGVAIVQCFTGWQQFECENLEIWKIFLTILWLSQEPLDQ